jgi:hypothetical protein
VPAGVAWLGIGLWHGVTRRRGSGAIVLLVPKTVPGFAVIGVLGAASLFFSAFVRHWNFTIVGARGVLMATLSAMSLLGRIAPLVIAVVGLALIAVGLRWSRWRETIRAAVLARLPTAARGFVTRLTP